VLRASEEKSRQKKEKEEEEEEEEEKKKRERREDLKRKFGVNRSALALISLSATKKVFRPPYPSGRLRIQGRTSPPREC